MIGKAGHQIDTDIVRHERSVDAVRRDRLFVVHGVQIFRRPVGVHLALNVAALKIVRAPVAHVGIDELRPKTNDVLRHARMDGEIELERYVGAVRNDLRRDVRYVDASDPFAEKFVHEEIAARVGIFSLSQRPNSAAPGSCRGARPRSGCSSTLCSIVQGSAATAGVERPNRPPSVCVSPASTDEILDAEPLLRSPARRHVPTLHRRGMGSASGLLSRTFRRPRG